MIADVVIATKNPDKVVEMEAVLGEVLPGITIVKGVVWPDVEETGATLEENALLKARAAMEATGYPAIADDTGLEVDALEGAPGVHTARFAGPDATYAENRSALLRALDEVDDRSARFRTAVAIVTPAGFSLVVQGVLEGRIALAEHGERGFGYDSVFEVDDEHTLADISGTGKNQMSHRRRAFEALAAALTALSEDHLP